MRISGVRGLHRRRKERGVRLFQSAADFWGPGTTFYGNLHGCQSVSIRCGFLGSGDPYLFDGHTDELRFNPVRISGVRGHPSWLLETAIAVVSIRCGFLGSGDATYWAYEMKQKVL